MRKSTFCLSAALIAAMPITAAFGQDQRDQRGFGQSAPSPPAQQSAPLTPEQQQQQQQPPSQRRANPPPQRPAQNPPPPQPQYQRPAQNNPPPQFQQRPPQPPVASGQAPPQPGGPPRGNFQPSGNPPPPGRPSGGPSFAQQHGGVPPAQFAGGHFYGHDFAHFTPHEQELWHDGRWHHEFHDGRYGWWYEVDGVWYFYDAPIYPYPDYVADVIYLPADEFAEDYDQPAPYYYYYCEDAQAYYPYVASCDEPWTPVPATPSP